jgi:excisionase family DNA binding protein
MGSMVQDELLTVADVARRLQASPATIRRWLRAGRLRGSLPGGDRLGYRIPASEVDRLLTASTPVADPHPPTR